MKSAAFVAVAGILTAFSIEAQVIAISIGFQAKSNIGLEPVNTDGANPPLGAHLLVSDVPFGLAEPGNDPAKTRVVQFHGEKISKKGLTCLRQLWINGQTEL